jgi:hypothetical protein
MNQEELAYCRSLLTEIKRLHAESQAKSVLLDSWTMQASQRSRGDWHAAVQTMIADRVFCSGVEASIEPYLSRLQRALHEVAAVRKS